jgi:hypothetical protein
MPYCHAIEALTPPPCHAAMPDHTSRHHFGSVFISSRHATFLHY